MCTEDSLKINVKYKEKIVVAKYKNYELAELIKFNEQEERGYYLIEYWYDEPYPRNIVYYQLDVVSFKNLQRIIDNGITDEIEKKINSITWIEIYL